MSDTEESSYDKKESSELITASEDNVVSIMTDDIKKNLARMYKEISEHKKNISEPKESDSSTHMDPTPSETSYEETETSKRKDDSELLFSLSSDGYTSSKTESIVESSEMSGGKPPSFGKRDKIIKKSKIKNRLISEETMSSDDKSFFSTTTHKPKHNILSSPLIPGLLSGSGISIETTSGTVSSQLPHDRSTSVSDSTGFSKSPFASSMHSISAMYKIVSSLED
jgi:hypothetical protein